MPPNHQLIFVIWDSIMNYTDNIDFFSLPFTQQLFVGFVAICTIIVAWIDFFISEIIYQLIGYRIIVCKGIRVSCQYLADNIWKVIAKSLATIFSFLPPPPSCFCSFSTVDGPSVAITKIVMKNHNISLKGPYKAL